MHLLDEVKLGRDELLETGLRLIAGTVGTGDPLGVVEAGLELIFIVLAAGGHPCASRDGPADEGLAAAALQRIDHLDDVLPPFFVVTGLALEAAFPFRIKVDHRALEQRPFVVAELSLEQWFADGFHVAIHAEVAAVDGDLGKGAARAWGAGLVPNLVAHELAHEAAVLPVVIESQVTQAADVLIFLVIVELHLERRACGVL